MKKDSPISKLFISFLILFGIYQLLRAGFLILNPSFFPGAENASVDPELLNAWLIGWRFDIAALALINGPIWLLYFFPSRQYLPMAHIQTFLSRLAFVLLNGSFIAANIGDMEYFQFSARRLTLNTFYIQEDLWNQGLNIAIYYWPLSLLMALTFLALIPLAITTFRPFACQHMGKRSMSTRLAYDLGLTLAIIALTVLAGRGGWQKKPLIAAHAYINNSAELAPVSLNSSFSFLKSLDQKPLDPLSYYPDWPSIEAILESKEEKTAKTSDPSRLKGSNVVVIVMESFGLEYMQEGYMPFLSELARKGRFYHRNFANGRRSIDAIPAIFAGIPAWMKNAFITSNFQTNRINGLAQTLGEHGYSSRFFHGGSPGTMFFDLMARKTGFHEYIDASNYPRADKDFDGQWGIFDEPFLQFTAQALDQQPSPFVAGIFTLSSHHPYTIPAPYKGQFPKGTLEIHESIGYADHALKMFFQTASKKSWYDNTLFVITADHTSKAEKKDFQSELGRFRVPLIFFHPTYGLDSLAETSQITQHLDIKPTILDLLDLPFHSGFGQSLRRKQKSLAIVASGESYIGASEFFHVRFSSPDLWQFYRPDDFLMVHPIEISSIDPELVRWHQSLMKARIQAFRNGLIEDKLVW